MLGRTLVVVGLARLIEEGGAPDEVRRVAQTATMVAKDNEMRTHALSAVGTIIDQGDLLRHEMVAVEMVRLEVEILMMAVSDVEAALDRLHHMEAEIKPGIVSAVPT